MRAYDFILDDRIDDNTIIIIKDVSGRPIACGSWYEDRILFYCNGKFDVSFDYDAERNIAIFQLL